MEAFSFVLGAAVVGGIALVRELFVDRRRWQCEQRAYDRITRAARRLVADELDTARNDMELMLKKNAWPVAAFVDQASFLPAREWERNKSRLAEAVDDENTWVVVAAFYYSLTTLRVSARAPHSGDALNEKERGLIRSMQDQATVLQAVLAEGVPLPDNWREQYEAVRAAGKLPVVDKPQPRTSTDHDTGHPDY